MELLTETFEHIFFSAHTGLDYVTFPTVDGVSSATSLSRKKGENNTKRYEASSSLQFKSDPYLVATTADISQEENFESFGVQPRFAYATQVWSFQTAFRYQKDNFKVTPFFTNYSMQTLSTSLFLSRVINAKLTTGAFFRFIQESGDFRDFLLGKAETGVAFHIPSEKKTYISGLNAAVALSANQTIKLTSNFFYDSWTQTGFSAESQFYQRLYSDFWLKLRYRYYLQQPSKYIPSLTENTPGIYLQYHQQTAHEIGAELFYTDPFYEIFFRYDRRLQELLPFHVFQLGLARKW
ncbi:MAG: hypothetical protein D6767_02540 [Candidatus Hydrogenedentota bacterium]|nr:MAG: hypothetical protein D6767_02540 [Candidatus Hydrogenedentota bacterium]